MFVSEPLKASRGNEAVRDGQNAKYSYVSYINKDGGHVSKVEKQGRHEMSISEHLVPSKSGNL